MDSSSHPVMALPIPSHYHVDLLQSRYCLISHNTPEFLASVEHVSAMVPTIQARIFSGANLGLLFVVIFFSEDQIGLQMTTALLTRYDA